MRIAVASTPLTQTLDQAVSAAVAAVEEAGRQGAQIVCLPETGLPGHRGHGDIGDVTAEELEHAVDAVAAAAARAGVTTIVGAERPTPAGREIVSHVLGADGARLGTQAKTQIDPTEEAWYVAGSGRRVFRAAGVTFGVAICHEAFRYPEISRALALGGAQVIFVPHDVWTDDGSRPTRWRDPENPYNETALRLRAMENTVYVAQANVAAPDQGSITGIVAPDGSLLAGLPYGEAGVVAADIDLALADRRLALRWAPERNVPA
jgi:predicted amidohydrolase